VKLNLWLLREVKLRHSTQEPQKPAFVAQIEKKEKSANPRRGSRIGDSGKERVSTKA